MPPQRVTDWQFWNSVVCARIPLRLLLEPRAISTRTQMKEFSASAYIYRMFELFFFNLRDPSVTEHFHKKERKDLGELLRTFDALAWRPLPSHPHISELADDDFTALVPSARRLDRHLWLRSGRGFFPVIYRMIRGWPLFESSLKAKEEANQSLQPTAPSRRG